MAGRRCAELAEWTAQFAGHDDSPARWQVRGAARRHSPPCRSQRQSAFLRSSSIPCCSTCSNTAHAGARCITSAARARRTCANGPATKRSSIDGCAGRDGESLEHRIQEYLLPVGRRAAGSCPCSAGGLEGRPPMSDAPSRTCVAVICTHAVICLAWRS